MAHPTHAANGPIIERMAAPVLRFVHTEASSGIVLLAATVVALVWANSPWHDGYHHLFETELTLGLGNAAFTRSLHYLITDGLMAVFFFLVGLEIKREVLAGELSSLQTASLPVIAALGGMIVPASIYATLTWGTPELRGWGVPMATDIAFSLGVLALLGNRIPRGLKIFLAALAIADDIGAILVIALFYSEGVDWFRLGGAAALIVSAVLVNRMGVRSPVVYGAIGLALWVAVSGSGVHATVAGVVLAMTIPVRTRINEREFLTEGNRALRDFDDAATATADNPEVSLLSNVQHHVALQRMEELCERAQPPLIRMEHGLHGIVAFGIMPLFALANAGVSLSVGQLGTAMDSPATLAVFLGLLIGKPIGVFGFSWVATRIGLARLPLGVDWRMLGGAGALAGIGFTMSLFVGQLAFGAGPLLEASKIGIFAASLCSGILGWTILRTARRA